MITKRIPVCACHANMYLRLMRVINIYTGRCIQTPDVPLSNSMGCVLYKRKRNINHAFTAEGMGAVLIFQKGAGKWGKPTFFLFKAKAEESQRLSFMTGPVLEGRVQLMVLLWAAFSFLRLHKESHVWYLDMMSFVQSGAWLLLALLHPTLIWAQQGSVGK